MTIAVGDRFPTVTLKHVADSGLEDLSTESLVSGKKVVIFGVPGAYTPTCSRKHLPGYVEAVDQLAAQGVDAVACLSVNDPWVMQAWAADNGAEGKITMLPDGNGELTKALGLEMDGSGACLGLRCKRFSMVVEDGVVKKVEVESNPGAVEVSGAGTCLTGI